MTEIKTLRAHVPLRIALLLLCAGPLFAQARPFRFVDATPDSGIEYRNVCGAPPESKGWLNEGMGAGAAWLDYDADGKLDLYIVNGSTFERAKGKGEPNRLYRGDGRGHFVETTDAAGVGDRGWGYGVAVGDIDNDGLPDLYVTNMGPNVLYRNLGKGRFEDVTRKAGVAGPDIWSSSSAFFDMENDGDLDLYVTNYMICSPETVARGGSPQAVAQNCAYRGVQVFCGPLGEVPHQDTLYRNNGDGTFTDVTREAGLGLETPRYALGVVTGDYDLDGDQDIYVANDSVSNSLWENVGQGKFREVGLIKLVALNADGRAQAGMGTAFGDYNDDGWPDLIVTNFSQDLNTLYKNMEGKFFIDDSQLAGMSVTHLALSWGVGFHDFDHDADVDLLIANGHVYPQVDGHSIGTEFRQINHLFRNDGAGRFTETSASAGPAFRIKRSFRGAAFADYDDDGDVDVFLTTLDEEPLLVRNDTDTTGAHWLQVRLIGSESNRDAIGAKVRVRAEGKSQLRERNGGGSYLSSSDPRLHFGLGAATRAEVVEIRWPGGRKQVRRDVPADRVLTLRESDPAE